MADRSLTDPPQEINICPAADAEGTILISYFAAYVLFSVFSQGVKLTLLRMAREMQACLPTRRTATTMTGKKSSSAAPETTAAANTGGDQSKATINNGGDRGVQTVQREHGRVAAAAVLLKQHLFRHQGTVSAALVLGGVDILGPHLYQVGVTIALLPGKIGKAFLKPPLPE